MFSIPDPPFEKKRKKQELIFWLRDSGGYDDPESKRWYYPADVREKVEHTLALYGFWITTLQRFDHSHISVEIEDVGADYLSEFAEIVGYDDNPSQLTLDQAKLLYRKAAIKLHPDRGGSSDAMAELNITWQHVQKQLFKV